MCLFGIVCLHVCLSVFRKHVYVHEHFRQTCTYRSTGTYRSVSWKNKRVSNALNVSKRFYGFLNVRILKWRSITYICPVMYMYIHVAYSMDALLFKSWGSNLRKCRQGFGICKSKQFIRNRNPLYSFLQIENRWTIWMSNQKRNQHI